MWKWWRRPGSVGAVRTVVAACVAVLTPACALVAILGRGQPTLLRVLLGILAILGAVLLAALTYREQRLPFLKRRAQARSPIIEHFEPRGRGVRQSWEPGQYFTGRVEALRELVSWLAPEGADRRGRVVTGDPGSGKSAVLGRLVALSDPELREDALKAGAPEGTVPAEGAIDVAVHVKGKKLAEVAAEIAEVAELDLDAPVETPGGGDHDRDLRPAPSWFRLW